MNLFFSLVGNIINNWNYLVNDFLGFSLNLSVIINFLINFLIAFLFIFTSFSFGKKLIQMLSIKLKNNDYNYLIYIALGYIFISTGFALLGFFSLLKPPIILFYLTLVLIFSFLFSLSLKKNFYSLSKGFIKSFTLLKLNKFVFTWVILFIVLAFINLVNLEIREDQYHVDFPKIFLANNTIMTLPKEPFYVSASPMLSEMFYTVGIFLFSKETARYIHFSFYVLAILTLIEFSRLKKYKFSIFTPLLFASAPVVIKETSSMYSDFQWIFCFLLAIILTLSNSNKSTLKYVLSGILFGGMLASKLWTIVFLPVFIIYLFIMLNENNKFKYIFIFFISVLFISSFWYFRAFLLTGNPFYPAFINETNLEQELNHLTISDSIGINYPLLNPLNYKHVFSPLFFLGIIFFLYKFNENIKILKKLNLFKLFFLLLFLYLSIHYPFGRYLLGLYVLFIFISSLGIEKIYRSFKFSRYFLNLILLVLFSYYSVNSLLVMPYSLGIADKNKYLSRVLIRDNSSYYDFGRKFDKFISKDDLVATYGIFGYYYANFNFIDINFILDENNRSFPLLKEYGATKLFIKGGGINWFCNRIKLTNCNKSNYELISNYLGHPTYYLYNIK